jgi:hypothetical protein
VRVTLNGRYKLKEANNKCRVISTDANTTVLEFTSIHGLSVEVMLSKLLTTDISNTNKDAGAEIILYPNPVKNRLYIKSELQLDSLTICNQSGQMVYNSVGHINEIDVAHLAKGIYFLDVNFGNGENKVYKFIKK